MRCLPSGNWRKKGPDVLMDRSSVSMAVVKDEDGLVWLADRKGEGFVIKK